MMQESLKLRAKAGQHGGDAEKKDRRDVRLVHYDRAVRAHFDDACKAECRVTRATFVFVCQPETQSANRDIRDGLVAGIGVDRLVFGNVEARGGSRK